MLAISLALLLLVSPALSQAAVSCADANAFAQTFGTPADPMTDTYTRPSGSEFVGFFLVGHRQSGGARTISSIAWGASTPTSITTATYTDPAGGELFRLIAPPSGAQTVSASWSGARLTDGLVVFVCTGADQTTPTHDPISTSGSSATAATTVSNVVASDVVIACVTRSGTTAMTGSGSLVQIAQDASPEEMNVGCWYQPGSAGGSVSVSLGVSNAWTIQAIAVSPPSADLGGGALWYP